jgi:DedD protein
MGLFSFGGNSQQDADDDQTPVRPRRSARTPEDEPMDPMLPEKKRARRRLIGATALVLAAVIGLPMIFDADPRPISQDINIQIPPRDKAPAMNGSPMPLPLPPAAHPEAPQPEAPKSEQPKAEPPKASAAEPESAAPVVSDAKPQARQANSASPSSDKAATVAVGDKRVDSLVDKPSAASPDSAKSVDKDKGRFIVQVAAVSNKAKVDELLQKLKRGGIDGYWQKVTTKEGDRFRVRVGPFSSRSEAEKMSKRIDKLGLRGTIQAI